MLGFSRLYSSVVIRKDHHKSDRYIICQFSVKDSEDPRSNQALVQLYIRTPVILGERWVICELLLPCLWLNLNHLGRLSEGAPFQYAISKEIVHGQSGL
jgi:hypothetical protein